MRVAFLSTDPSVDLSKPGGPRAHILGTIRGMKENGLEVRRFFASETGQKCEPNEVSGRKSPVPPAQRSKIRLILSDLKKLICNWSLDKPLERKLSEYKPDVIYERSWLFSFGGVRYARKHKIPIFLETSGCEAEITAEAYGISSVSIANGVDALKFKMARAVVTQSVNSIAATKRKFRLNVPVIAKPIGFEKNAIAKGGDVRAGDEVSLFKDRFKLIVGFVGTFGVYQGPDFLMQVIAEMHQSCPKVGFLLIGGGGKQADCVQFAEENGLQNVYFTGLVEPDSIAEWLDVCDLAFVPDCDPYMSPIKVLEYGVYGKPVVVPDYVAFDGLIINGETGRRFDALDECSAVEVLASMADAPDQIREMGENLRYLVSEHYNHARVVEPLAVAMKAGCCER